VAGRRGPSRPEHLRTSAADLYAANDVIGDPRFVYVAAYGASVAAENALTGLAKRYDLTALPRVTFTDPAVGSAPPKEGGQGGTDRPVDWEIVKAALVAEVRRLS
jgi:pyruvate/2-oxoglutarate dehydrogenase complex dihydrolipoamide dehydrogenase (E3) component